MSDNASLFSILASGAAGALLATGLGVLFDLWRERIRLRASVMLAVVGWADDAYIRLMDLHVAKHAEYAGAKSYLSQPEYDLNSRELRSLLLRQSVGAQLAIVYGEREELRLLNELRQKLLDAARLLWRAKAADWAQVEPKVEKLFADQIDPLRAKLEHELLRQANPTMWLLRMRERMVEGPGWSTVAEK